MTRGFSHQLREGIDVFDVEARTQVSSGTPTMAICAWRVDCSGCAKSTASR